MTVLLSPLPKLRFVDSNGNALSGGKLFTYTAGTTTKLSTYTDNTGGTPNTNPIILDSRGECNCWLTSGSSYKFVLSPSTDTDPPTNAIWTVDGITSQSISVPVTVANGGTNAITANAARQNLAITFNKYATAGTSTLAASNVGQVIAPSTTGVTLTMPPTAGLSNGDTFTFFQANANDTLTITRNSAETFIGGGYLNATSITLSNQGDSLTVQFDGSNYRVLYAPQRQIPQGRLTLTSNTPILTADATAQTTVYYTPYIGNQIPVGSGILTFAQISLALDSNAAHTGYQQSGKNFDLFIFNNSGNVALGTGPAWTSDTGRGTGAGTTELQMVNGIWTNKNSINLKPDSTATQVTVAANEATYVGTMRTTADGQTGMAFKPTAAAGGTNNVLGLWNSYNRVRTTAYSRDSNTNWSYNSATWRSADNNTSNRISWVDGLQQSRAEATYNCEVTENGTSTAVIGVNFDSTSATPSGVQAIVTAGSAITVGATVAAYDQTIALGLHFAQAMESVATGTANYNAAGSTQALTLSLDM